MVVYLAYTRSDRDPVPTLLRVYKKSSYQTAYNWLADIAERHGQKVTAGDAGGSVAAQTCNPEFGQFWWLQRHEAE